MNEDVGTSSTKQTHSKLLIAVTASQRAEAKGRKNNQNRPSVWVLKKTAGAEITWKGLQSSPSNFSVSHLHSLSPANPVMCASPIHRLQQNRDWLLCAVLSDGSFKKRGLPQPSRHPFGPALLCQAHRMRCCRRTDGRTDGDGQVETGWSTLKTFLLTTIWHTGRRKAISTAANSYFFPPHQHFITANVIYNRFRDIKRSWGHGEKYTPGIKSDFPDILCIRTAGYIYTVCTSVGCLWLKFLTLLQSGFPNIWDQIFQQILRNPVEKCKFMQFICSILQNTQHVLKPKQLQIPKLHIWSVESTKKWAN